MEICSAAAGGRERGAGEAPQNVTKNVDVEALAGGLNKRKMLEQAVCNELCSMLDPGKEPYALKKKQANVIMFVGLQVREDDDVHQVRVHDEAEG